MSTSEEKSVSGKETTRIRGHYALRQEWPFYLKDCIEIRVAGEAASQGGGICWGGGKRR